MLTVTEASTELQVSPCRVRVLIRSGRLRAVRKGGIWMIERAALGAVRVRVNGRPRGK